MKILEKKRIVYKYMYAVLIKFVLSQDNNCNLGILKKIPRSASINVINENIMSSKSIFSHLKCHSLSSYTRI